jgi:nucleoside-diphosphate-sugar epimerase
MAGDRELHVVFGAGPIGTAVARRLLARGRRVRIVSRSERSPAPAGAEAVRGDAADPATARHLAAGAAVVYNTAAPPYARWPEEFPPLQAGIIEGAAAAGAKLVSAENLYMYGRVRGPIVEDLPYAARTRKGRARAKVAEALLAAHAAGKVRATIGRAANYYGPAAPGSAMGERVFYPLLASKRVSVLGDPDAPHTYTYIEDFAEALIVLGEREEALGQAWHVPSAPTLTTRRFLDLAFRVAGLPAKIGAVPGVAVKALGLVNRDMREVGEMLYEFEGPFVVDHTKYARAFGDHATPHEVALRDTLAWYRTHPKA